MSVTISVHRPDHPLLEDFRHVCSTGSPVVACLSLEPGSNVFLTEDNCRSLADQFRLYVEKLDAEITQSEGAAGSPA